MMLKIRKRELQDSKELAHAIALAWNTTYKGIVDDEFLEGLLKNEKQSEEKLRNNKNIIKKNLRLITMNNNLNVSKVFF